MVYMDGEEKEKPKSCREKIAPYIINPMNPYAVTYDMFISFMYLVAYFSDIYVICFKYMPLEKPKLRLFQTLTTITFVIDMLL